MLKGQGIGEEDGSRWRMEKEDEGWALCQAGSHQHFLSLLSDSQLSVLPKKNLKIWVRRGMGGRGVWSQILMEVKAGWAMREEGRNYLKLRSAYILFVHCSGGTLKRGGGDGVLF